MTTDFFRACAAALPRGAAGSRLAAIAAAEPQHGIAMYGEPALPPDFVALPYANPDAPKGGTHRHGRGRQLRQPQSLHPQGQRRPGSCGYLIGESLMGRTLDEPFTLYGLLAESVETGPNREWVEFTLRPEARVLRRHAR